uniref:Ubiquinone biosynthesis O-methyltransferase, mitochondrial n=1 Tax=Ciona savignyi TaxID=51511 RepID=H2YX78_CIOSA
MMSLNCRSCGRLLTRWWMLLKSQPARDVHCFRKKTPKAIENVIFRTCDSKQRIRFMTSQPESEKFSRLARNWWDEDGEMKALHSMNELRVPFIRDALISLEIAVPNTSKPLQGVKILEVGCGAGVLCEPLARLGASVLGIDTSDGALAAAKMHRGDAADLSELQYIDATLEDIVGAGTLRFDVVVASEVVEHVDNKAEFVTQCCDVLKPNGSLFLSTINRTQMSYFLAIMMAEKVLGVVPDGTHDWKSFVTHSEIKSYLDQGNAQIQRLEGMAYNPVLNKWTWCKNTDVNYILHAYKIDDTSANNTEC